MNKTHKKKTTDSGNLNFDEESHKYYVGGIEYLSATTFIKSFFHKFKDKDIAGYVAKARQNKGENITAKDVLNEWKLTAETGTLVHKEIQKYIQGNKKPTHSKSKVAVAYLHEHGLMEKDMITIPEFMLKDDEHKIAGTCDLIVVKKGTSKFMIFDWKTNKTIMTRQSKKGKKKATRELDDCNYVHYTLQLSLYAYMFSDLCGMTEPDSLKIVHLKDDSYFVYDVPYMKETIMEMLKWRKKQLQKKH